MTSTHIDFIIRVKNGYMARNEKIQTLYSKMNVSISEILKKEGYIENMQIIEDGAKKSLELVLKYNEGNPVLSNVKIVSRPGKRIYQKVKELKPVLGGMGILILSTPQGVITGREARKKV